jgi:hypothetical protein
VSFFAPLWLLLGAAAAVPLLLHLLRRRTGVRTEFPAARYLLRAEREHSRSLRLRNLLLMLLRVVVVLLLALAAARPMGWLPGAAAAGHAPTALVIVVDNSLSTSVIQEGRPVLERLRAAAARVVDAASPDDRVYVVDAGGSARGGLPSVARAALDAVQPMSGAGDMGAAVRRAAAVAHDARTLTPRVVVFTDGQRSAWREPVQLPKDVLVTLVTVDDDAPRNRAVVVAVPRPTRWTPAGVLEIRTQATDSAVYRVQVRRADGAWHVVARGVAAPGEATAVRLAPDDTGWLAGRVEIDGDELPGDDVRYFAVWTGETPRVAVMPGAGPFARNAIDAIRGTGAITSGDGVRVVAANELGEWSGPALVLPPMAPAQLGAANVALARRGIPWRFGAAVGAGAIREDSLLAGTPVRRAYELVPTSGTSAETLAVVNGAPWAVGGAAGGARYVVIASPLTPDATDLPVRAAFVPWLGGLLHERLVGAEGDAVSATPGQQMRRPAHADSIRSPDGARIALGGAVMTAPAAPGVYFLHGRDDAVGAVVVNVEETESLLDRLHHDTLAARFRGPRVTTLPIDDVSGPRLFAAGGTRSLIPILLIGALLALAVEGAVTAFRARGPA